MKDEDFYNLVFSKDPREEMQKNLKKKINGIFRNNKNLKKEAEVKELVSLVENIANCFDQLTIYAFSATELRDLHRKKAGII